MDYRIRCPGPNRGCASPAWIATIWPLWRFTRLQEPCPTGRPRRRSRGWRRRSSLRKAGGFCVRREGGSRTGSRRLALADPLRSELRGGADHDVQIFLAGAVVGEVGANRERAANAGRRRRGDAGFLEVGDDVFIELIERGVLPAFRVEAEAHDVERRLAEELRPRSAADEAGEVLRLATVPFDGA